MLDNSACRASTALIVQRLLGGVSGAAVLAYVLLRPHYLPSTLHGTRKLLATLMSSFMIVYNVCIVTSDVFRLLLHRPLCELNPLACTSLRAGAVGSLTALSISHFLMAADRLFETTAPMLYRNVLVPKAIGIIVMIITSFTALSILFIFDHSATICIRAATLAFASSRETRLAYLFVALFTLEIASNITYVFVFWRTRIGLNRSATTAGAQIPLKVRVGLISIRFLAAHIVIRMVFVVFFVGANALLRLRLLYHPEERRTIYTILDHFYIVQWYGLSLGIFSLIWRSSILRQKYSSPHIMGRNTVNHNDNNCHKDNNIVDENNNKTVNDCSNCRKLSIIEPIQKPYPNDGTSAGRR